MLLSGAALDAPTAKRVKPGNDNRTEPEPSATPAIVTTVSPTRAKLLRAERAMEPDDDPVATARVKAFFARMMRPGGALPPKR